LKSNITFIALNKSFKKEIAKALAENLCMFYIDINDYINYQLNNINNVITLAGIEYYNEQETKIVKTVASYEDTVITLNLNTFFNNNNYKVLKENSLFIYLRIDFDTYKKNLDKDIPKHSKAEKSLNKKVFTERDKIIKLESDITIDFSLNCEPISLIVDSIKDYYKRVYERNWNS